jgi:hypothetical protein
MSDLILNMEEITQSYKDELNIYEKFEEDPVMKDMCDISKPLVLAAINASYELPALYQKAGRETFLDLLRSAMINEDNVPLIRELFIENKNPDLMEKLEKEYNDALNQFNRDFLLEHMDKLSPEILIKFLCRCIRENCFQPNFVEAIKLSPLAPSEIRHSLLKSKWSDVPE